MLLALPSRSSPAHWDAAPTSLCHTVGATWLQPQAPSLALNASLHPSKSLSFCARLAVSLHPPPPVAPGLGWRLCPGAAPRASAAGSATCISSSRNVNATSCVRGGGIQQKVLLHGQVKSPSFCCSSPSIWLKLSLGKDPSMSRGKEGLSKRARSRALSPFLLCTHLRPCQGAACCSGGLQLPSRGRAPSLGPGCAGAGAAPWWLLPTWGSSRGSGRAAVTQWAQNNQKPTPDAVTMLPTPLLAPAAWPQPSCSQPPALPAGGEQGCCTQQCLLVETLLQEGARVSVGRSSISQVYVDTSFPPAIWVAQGSPASLPVPTQGHKDRVLCPG